MSERRKRELAELTAFLQAREPAAPESRVERRAMMDRFGEAGALPHGCRHEPVTANGVSCERVIPGNAAPGRRIFYLHGGAYTGGSPRSHRSMVGWIAHAARAEALVVDYRLAPEAPFPAGLEDAVAAYRWLLDEVGGEADRIVFAGDSAGGGLCLATALAVKGRGLPQPAGVFVISPWADLTQSSKTYRSKAQDDWMITKAGLDENAALYLGSADATDPLASPVFGELAGLPPLLIQVGSEEALLGDSLLLAERAGLARVEVRLEIWPEMFHVWHAFGGRLFDARRAIAEAGAWIDTRLGGPG